MKEKSYKLIDTVEEVLRKKKSTRNDDDILYMEVCKSLNPYIDIISFGSVMRNRMKLGIPVYESVRRARAKLQSKYPELRDKYDGVYHRTDRLGFLKYKK